MHGPRVTIAYLTADTHVSNSTPLLPRSLSHDGSFVYKVNKGISWATKETKLACLKVRRMRSKGHHMDEWMLHVQGVFTTWGSDPTITHVFMMMNDCIGCLRVIHVELQS